MQVIVSLGSNIGASKKNIKDAIILILEKCEIEAESSLMLSSPVGELKQADFYNKILLLNTDIEPYALLEFFKFIEHKMGRIPRARWFEREIDIDIICYEGQTIKSETLCIPHKELSNRLFVLIGGSQVAPNYLIEGLAKTFTQLYDLRKNELKNQKVLCI